MYVHCMFHSLFQCKFTLSILLLEYDMYADQITCTALFVTLCLILPFFVVALMRQRCNNKSSVENLADGNSV